MPSERVLFLTVDEVLAIHERLLEAFGGAAGVRDHGLLESALFRPQTGVLGGLVGAFGVFLDALDHRVEALDRGGHFLDVSRLGLRTVG